jgi:hypothetical protein
MVDETELFWWAMISLQMDFDLDLHGPSYTAAAGIE